MEIATFLQTTKDLSAELISNLIRAAERQLMPM